MTGSDDNGDVVAADEDAAYDEHYEEADPSPSPRLRRSPFGFKPADVRAELRARKAECDEMRDDIAALWLVFNQQERAIRDLAAAVERLGGVRIAAPGARRWDGLDPEADPRPTPAPVPITGLQPPARLPASPAPTAGPPRSPTPPSPTPPTAAPTPAPTADAANGWIADQLEGLDDVLLAIRQATETLERTYDEQIAEQPQRRA